jgi:hypothetical protein
MITDMVEMMETIMVTVILTEVNKNNQVWLSMLLSYMLLVI